MPSGMRPAMIPISRPAGAVLKPPRAIRSRIDRAEQVRACPANAPLAPPSRCPRTAVPRQTMRPGRSSACRSSSARITTQPRLWPSKCTVSPGTRARNSASVAAFARGPRGSTRSRTSRRVETARLEQPAQNRHHAAHHPETVHGDDRVARATRRACVDASAGCRHADRLAAH